MQDCCNNFIRGSIDTASVLEGINMKKLILPFLAMLTVFGLSGCSGGGGSSSSYTASTITFAVVSTASSEAQFGMSTGINLIFVRAVLCFALGL